MISPGASDSLSRFRALYPEIQRDIFLFAKLLNWEPTWYQADVMRAVMAGKRRIALKSGQGPGKTALVSVIGMWRTVRAHKAMTILTAPSIKQCRDVFLAECQRLLDHADPMLRRVLKVTKTRLVVLKTRDWEIKSATASSSAGISGYHQSNMTIIVEEAQGVSDDIVQTLEGTVTNTDSLTFMVGNPTSAKVPFARCFTVARHLWETFTFNCEDVARDYPHIVSPERNRILGETYGYDSDVYRTRVLGEFPASDPGCVLGIADVEACVNNNAVSYACLNPKLRAFGIDLASFGEDESVIFRRQGNSIMETKVFNQTDPADVVVAAFRLQNACGWRPEDCTFVFDCDGMGAGVRHLFEAKRVRYVAFHSGGNAVDQREFADKLSEAWFTLAKLVRSRSCHLPNDPHLIEELTDRRYDQDPKGRLRVESKKVYRRRTKKKSPDRADALVMAFYAGVMGVDRVTVRAGAQAENAGWRPRH